MLLCLLMLFLVLPVIPMTESCGSGGNGNCNVGTDTQSRIVPYHDEIMLPSASFHSCHIVLLPLEVLWCIIEYLSMPNLLQVYKASMSLRRSMDCLGARGVFLRLFSLLYDVHAEHRLALIELLMKAVVHIGSLSLAQDAVEMFLHKLPTCNHLLHRMALEAANKEVSPILNYMLSFCDNTGSLLGSIVSSNPVILLPFLGSYKSTNQPIAPACRLYPLVSIKLELCQKERPLKFSLLSCDSSSLLNLSLNRLYLENFKSPRKFLSLAAFVFGVNNWQLGDVIVDEAEFFDNFQEAMQDQKSCFARQIIQRICFLFVSYLLLFDKPNYKQLFRIIEYVEKARMAAFLDILIMQLQGHGRLHLFMPFLPLFNASHFIQNSDTCDGLIRASRNLIILGDLDTFEMIFKIWKDFIKYQDFTDSILCWHYYSFPVLAFIYGKQDIVDFLLVAMNLQNMGLCMPKAMQTLAQIGEKKYLEVILMIMLPLFLRSMKSPAFLMNKILIAVPENKEEFWSEGTFRRYLLLVSFMHRFCRFSKDFFSASVPFILDFVPSQELAVQFIQAASADGFSFPEATSKVCLIIAKYRAFDQVAAMLESNIAAGSRYTTSVREK